MVVLVFFTSELLGIFDIHFSQNIINFVYNKILKKEAEKNIFIPNFLSGILAVLLATPCSAPFLGSAITFALTQDFLAIMLIFLTIGLGFGFPYIFLMVAPNLVNKLPKTAEWNLKIKKIMAGFLIATTIWISYILINNIGYLPGLIAIIIAVSFYKILQLKEKIIRNILIVIALILIFNVPFNIQKKQFSQTIIQNLYWKEFKEEDIAKYLSNDKVVLVDITADWCITCKFNKIRVLESKEITNLLESGEVIGLRGDITKPNEKIMDFLHKNNRYAIPFNIVYGPNAKEGIATSELLTKKELLTAIKKANKKTKDEIK
jgi:suppressor for copper-sensitivity B